MDTEEARKQMFLQKRWFFNYDRLVIISLTANAAF